MVGDLTWTKAVRRKYNKPCVTMGNIRDPRVADDILERGDADIIGSGSVD